MNLFRPFLTLKPRTHFLSSCSRAFSSGTSQTQETPSIAGTAPPYRCYVFLHSSVSPSAFPAKLMTPFQRALQAKLLQWGGFVNWVSYMDERSGVDPTQQQHHMEDGQQQQHYSATAFTMFGERVDIPSLSIRNIDEINEDLKKRVESNSGASFVSKPDETHLFVCTHMARDCRCGETGGEFVKALREEVHRRASFEPEGPYGRFRIGEVAHVGQHQYAANLLVYPQGDWLGLLTAQDVPKTLDWIIGASMNKHVSVPGEHWRGRMGLSKSEQLDIINSQ
ncbi:hypothetical protein K435DRAFT_861053 [Dendrothele bispora CBS 962.96]|uniref:Sucraseferredoxin-like protein n=1 Tax=Dendrothele bispora (strain CBS 962.96) TaxID=1314807 RepID=A0A4S8LXM7_DENBC|nr:hypothetical protein K435DRAFT_861053 [Dendrothele bispora CBS 962.96]